MVAPFNFWQQQPTSHGGGGEEGLGTRLNKAVVSK